jgi:hypothetical protein
MAPEVFFSVCYNTKDVPLAFAQQHSFKPALLHNYCRRRVRDADYPGIVADEGHSVFGMYCTGLTRANMQKLDFFEGDQYVRRRVRVALLDVVGIDPTGADHVEGDEADADVYVFVNKSDLEEAEWDFEHFRKERLKHWTRAGYVFSGE